MPVALLLLLVYCPTLCKAVNCDAQMNQTRPLMALIGSRWEARLAPPGLQTPHPLPIMPSSLDNSKRGVASVTQNHRHAFTKVIINKNVCVEK